MRRYGRAEGRALLLIDPEGNIKKIYRKVKVAGHVDTVIADLQALQVFGRIMIDTHSHLDSEQFAEDYQEVIRESFNSGVQAVILPAVELPDFNKIVQIAESDERLFFAPSRNSSS